MKRVTKKKQNKDYPYTKVKYILRVLQKSRNIMVCVTAYDEFQKT